MKLRINGNSIRMRLSDSELKELMELGVVTDRLSFPGGETLTYSLGKSEEQSAIFHDGNLRITFPGDTLGSWTDSQELGMEQHLRLPEGNLLQILVEKDLAP